MKEVYCPKCGRGYVEEIIKFITPTVIKGEIELTGKQKTFLYRCNDCNYEFAVVEGKQSNE